MVRALGYSKLGNSTITQRTLRSHRSLIVPIFAQSILLMKSQLTDYDIIYEKVPIFCYNTCAFAISNNPVLHSRTKHIDIRYYFIKYHILKGDIELHFIPIEYQLADIFSKHLDEPTFKRLIVELESQRVWFSTPSGVTHDEVGLTSFRNAIRPNYLAHLRDYAQTPSIEDVRAWSPSIGYGEEIETKGTFKKAFLPPRWRLLMAQIIQSLGGKTGGFCNLCPFCVLNISFIVL
ncbi:hypothetical protein Tco_0928999 [Tanacetum coccineum]